MTLDELKAQNAVDEVDTEDSPQEPTDEALDTEGIDTPEELDSDADLDEEEAGEDKLEAWMQTDDADKKFTDGDVAAAKKGLRAKLERKHTEEVDALKAENARLKQGRPQALQEPKFDDFEDSDDQEGAYRDARIDWKIGTSQAREQASRAGDEAKRKQDAVTQERSLSVDQHYIRAAELAEKSGISAEMYQASDLKVRQMIDSVFPDQGDLITDMLISSLGEGSEKVFFSIGVKNTRLSELKNLLQSDPSGIRAAGFLGGLKQELGAPSKRTTKTPKPASVAGGEKPSGAGQKALRKAYDKATTPQARFDARRAYTAAGGDSSTL